MTECPVCGSQSLVAVFALRNVPVLCNALAPHADAARQAPTGDVALTVCETCSLLFNAAFDPERMDYASDYENALHHSPRFRAFADAFAADLVARHGLTGKRVVEIGCGDGFMLRRLREQGVGEALGFDPAMAGRASPYQGDGVTIVPRYFEADRVEGDFDAVICRHVLEHLPNPLAFLAALRAELGGRPVPVYIEVPNGSWLVRTVSIWDVIYEHVTYFTAPSLAMLLCRAGFRVTSIAPAYGDQFLALEAMPAGSAIQQPQDGIPDEVMASKAFGKAAQELIEGWRKRLAGRLGQAVVWGAGSKGISFTLALGEASDAVAALVDLNPRKHGRRVPGSGHPVIAPDELPAIAPDLVLVSNGLYQREICGRLNALGLNPDVLVLTE